MTTIADQKMGQGGSYIADPKTGTLKLLERTEDAPRETAPEPVNSDSEATQADKE
jgi:hypothetical protein